MMQQTIFNETSYGPSSFGVAGMNNSTLSVFKKKYPSVNPPSDRDNHNYSSFLKSSNINSPSHFQLRKGTHKRERVLTQIKNPTKYLKKSLEFVEKRA